MGRYSHGNINKAIHGRRRLVAKENRNPQDLGKGVRKGSKLHNRLKNKPLIIMGNAYSLNYMDHDALAHFMILGCNRCLDPRFHFKKHPEFYTVVDRAPYIQQLKHIKEYKGVRVLSDTLFDHRVSCRRTKVQKVPDYDWFRYMAVSSSVPKKGKVYTYYCNDARVKAQLLPAIQTNLDQFMPGGANIAYCMLQIAIAMGANPIGICGVDMQWESTGKSHALGDGCGKKEGAFKFNTARVMKFFQAAAGWAKENGVKIYNLSPKGVLSPTFPRISEKEFLSKFGKYARGDSVCPRKLLELEPDKDLRLSGTGQHGRSKSDFKNGKPNAGFKAPAGGRPKSAGPRDRSRKSLQEYIDSVSRARRAKRKAGHKK